MALVATGPGITDISGSIGDVTYARNRYGLYARARVVPIDPATAPQLARRYSLQVASGQWSGTLNAEHRAKWRVFANANTFPDRFGSPRRVHPYHLWCRWRATQRILVSPYCRTPPPSLKDPPPDLSLSFTVNAARAITLSFDDSASWCSFQYPIPEAPGYFSDSALIIFCCKPHASGCTYLGGPYLIAGYLRASSVSPPTSPDTSLTYAFTLTAGQRVRLRAILITGDGGVSPPFYADSIVTA